MTSFQLIDFNYFGKVLSEGFEYEVESYVHGEYWFNYSVWSVFSDCNRIKNFTI